MSHNRDRPEGQPLRLDEAAASAEAGLPAFLARPAGAPVYHGFPLMEGADVDGWRLGMITDFTACPDHYGDAYVVAPDGRRAALVWESAASATYIQQVVPPDEGRWGIWAIGLPLPLRSDADAKRFLAAAIPLPQPEWEATRAVDS